MNNCYDVGSYTPITGCCISEKLGLYIVNHSIIGFAHYWMQGNDIIMMYTPNHKFVIYKHDCNSNLNFEATAKKIITRLMDSLRYDINTTINIDKIIEEVIENGKETINANTESGKS